MNDIFIDKLKDVRSNLESALKALEPHRKEFLLLYDTMEQLIRLVNIKIRHLSSRY
jgi:hypothetical protein